MRYTVTADVPDADRSDTVLHHGMHSLLLDLLSLRAEQIGYHVEAFPDCGPEPIHRGNTGPGAEPLDWFEVETAQDVFDRL